MQAPAFPFQPSSQRETFLPRLPGYDRAPYRPWVARHIRIPEGKRALRGAPFKEEVGGPLTYAGSCRRWSQPIAAEYIAPPPRESMDYLSEPELATIAALLSSERLGPFERLAGSLRGAVVLHQQMLRLGTSLMTITAVVEIALRNAVSAQLTDHFRTADWLRTPPSPFKWDNELRAKITQAEASARRTAYAKMTSDERQQLDKRAFCGGTAPPGLAHEHVLKARHRVISVSVGQLLVQLTMYFWKRLFSSSYEHTLWRPALKHVFPDKSVSRALVAHHLEALYQTRNRIAHHEPVYGHRLEEAEAAVEFVARGLHRGGTKGATPLQKLLQTELAELRMRTETANRLFAAPLRQNRPRSNRTITPSPRPRAPAHAPPAQ